MAFVIATPIKGTIWLRDDASVPILGASLSGEAFDQNGVIAVLSVTQINASTVPGAYQWSFTPTTAGVSWTAHINFNANGIQREWSDDYDVVTASQADPAQALSGATITSHNPVAADGGRITLYQGVSYSTVLGNALVWTYTGPTALGTAETITLTIHSRTVRVEVDATVTGVLPAQTITAELTGAQTDELLISQVTVYEMTALIADDEVVLFTGEVTVLQDVTP